MKCTKGLVKYCHKTSYCDSPGELRMRYSHSIIPWLRSLICTSTALPCLTTDPIRRTFGLYYIRDALFLLRTIQFRCVIWKSRIPSMCNTYIYGPLL